MIHDVQGVSSVSTTTAVEGVQNIIDYRTEEEKKKNTPTESYTNYSDFMIPYLYLGNIWILRSKRRSVCLFCYIGRSYHTAVPVYTSFSPAPRGRGSLYLVRCEISGCQYSAPLTHPCLFWWDTAVHTIRTQRRKCRKSRYTNIHFFFFWTAGKELKFYPIDFRRVALLDAARAHRVSWLAVLVLWLPCSCTDTRPKIPAGHPHPIHYNLLIASRGHHLQRQQSGNMGRSACYWLAGIHAAATLATAAGQTYDAMAGYTPGVCVAVTSLPCLLMWCRCTAELIVLM